MLYANSTTTLARLAAGTSTHVLTSNGAGQAPSWQAAAGGGGGFPAVRSSGRSAAQTAAVASVATYTVGGSDGTFEVSANVLITSVTAADFNVRVAYTDESNTARTATLVFTNVDGAVHTDIDETGLGVHQGLRLHIRCKAATAITISTSGTFTTVTYNVEGLIVQTS